MTNDHDSHNELTNAYVEKRVVRAICKRVAASDSSQRPSKILRTELMKHNNDNMHYDHVNDMRQAMDRSR